MYVHRRTCELIADVREVVGDGFEERILTGPLETAREDLGESQERKAICLLKHRTR